MNKLSILGVTEDTMFVAGGRLAFFQLMRSLSFVGNFVIVVTNTGASSAQVNITPARMVRLSVPQKRFVAPAFFILKLFTLLPKLIPLTQVVLVNSGYTLPIVVVFAKVFRKKVVVLQHDALSLEYSLRLATSRSRKLTTIIRWISLYPPLKLVDGIISVSNETLKN
ncbi:hypothetical protein B9Q01_02110 [Candidatus Marsarchaeota G1 archaeon OSP_D]|jgi:hypothetical protein|uniref:Glycosyltransferase subfamily 4-like N-terminal domain-containing protein n=2 Tax=Candidatus Marsarchaeota group 1 TaxID=2203770 RepID=A0A2R6AJU3_9ARCH|nr:MAG: hypothetical protein B9Q01_02110 [Candidatus Marsarchaeota G1 archaeon OSP_D]PSN86640.1 MAG: hypothetical protein B9Q02_01370 [Candidatus Marsarchaeota G1 archaeon BE_D]